MGFADKFAGYDASGADERLANNGLVPPGFYKATLVGVKQKTANSGSSGTELSFEIAAGPLKGAEVIDTLWDTENKKARDRAAMFAVRIGLLTRGEDGKELLDVDGKEGWEDCLDAECAIEVQHEPYKNDATGKEGVGVRLTFNGLRRLDDPEVVAALANGGQKVEKPVKGAAAGTGKAAPPRPIPAVSEPSRGGPAKKPKAEVVADDI